MGYTINSFVFLVLDQTDTEDKDEMKGNYVVVQTQQGLSTTQLVIIILGVIGCIAIVVILFLLKR